VRYSSIRGLLTIGVLACILMGGPAGQSQQAQQPPPPAAGKPSDKPQEQTQPPRFRADVNLVRVDAYPLRDGKPVFDLTAEEFEVFEDGVLQKIVSFEHVVVRPAGPQTERIEVSSQRESLQAAANPRNRVFVIFLDTPNVAVESAHRINEPLIRLMDRILGPDDLVGVMTPAMAASQIVLGRKTQVIEDSLRRNWPWGTRGSVSQRDAQEESYSVCYPPYPGEGNESPVVHEMIARKRERATLEALEDLVRYLRTVREERKAILTVTEGWLLYAENPRLTKLRENPLTGQTEPIPGVDPVGVGPTGQLTAKDPRRNIGGALSKSECDSDRMRLAAMDNRQFFRDLLADANRGNASFYPIDPRGLAVFDTPLGPAPPPPINVDMNMLKERVENLKTLAENTDGIAVVNSNDLDTGLRRISDDLTSYYLLGYYSSNPKLDGRYRALKVRVKQPGVQVRARPGYRAATEAEVTAARSAADVPVPEATRAITAAIDRLGRVRPDTRFLINAVASEGAKRSLWVAGELQPPAGRPDDFAQGATADVEATAGGASTTTRVTLKAGERTFLTTMPLPAGGNEVSIRARLVASSGGALPVSDMLRIDTSSGIQPLLFRRGLSTGNRLVPAADLRFSRTERVRLELPVGADVKPGGGRLLDRAGQPMQVPVTVGGRVDEATGQQWITADVVLAALSGGDYAVEVEVIGVNESQRIVSAIRVVR
jgi:VWFA-related protein